MCKLQPADSYGREKFKYNKRYNSFSDVTKHVEADMPS